MAIFNQYLFSDIFSTKTLLSLFVTSGMLSSVDSQHRWEVEKTILIPDECEDNFFAFNNPVGCGSCHLNTLYLTKTNKCRIVGPLVSL